MTEQGLKEFLDENKVEIQAAVKAGMIDSLLSQHRWEISSQIVAIPTIFSGFISARRWESHPQKPLI